MSLLRSRWGYVLDLVVALVLLCVARQPTFAQSPALDPAITQVVIKLAPVAGATVAEINATYGTTTIKPLLNRAGIYLLQAPTGITAAALAEKMAADLRLLYAEPNFVHEAPEGTGRHTWGWGGNDAAPLDLQYAINQLGLPAAWSYSRGAGVVVAVLDSEIQLDHPALATVWTTERYDFVDDDSDPQYMTNDITTVASGHGTHVAGIIHLVAPDAHIMPLRVLDSQARGDIFRLAEAIIYATDHGANVINLSLGTRDESALLAEVTQRATMLGVTVVAAAGNLNEKDRQYPAAGQCVLAVTALDEQQRKADFANYGSWIDLAAPGVGIYSTLPPDGYGWWSGTSMATPWVAGQAALIYSMNARLNVRQIAELMVGTAQSVDRVNSQARGKLGAGLPAIDVSLARLQRGDLPHVGGTMSGSCVEPPATTGTATHQAPSSQTLERDLKQEDLLQENMLFLPLVRHS
ncbi:MAG: S8 family serine peptidase [Caldilineaceae bacterium]